MSIIQHGDHHNSPKLQELADKLEGSFSGDNGLVKAGSKRMRDPDQTVDATQWQQIMSSVIRGAKRMKLDERENSASDSTRCSTSAECHHFLLSDGSWKVVDAGVKASFNDLPEELILEIAKYLQVRDVTVLTSTNRRFSFILKNAKIVWMHPLKRLMGFMGLKESAATFEMSSLTNRAVREMVLHSYKFNYALLPRQDNTEVIPATSMILKTGQQSTAAWIQFPILLPGGRWLFAVCQDPKSERSLIGLWDLTRATLKQYPIWKMYAKGTVMSFDVKMELGGEKVWMAVVSWKKNVFNDVIYQADVYTARLQVSHYQWGNSVESHDAIQLNLRRPSEIQIYPQRWSVLIGLFDRVLLWEYKPINKCAWIITSRYRHRMQRYCHNRPFAMSLTHECIIIADGDATEVKIYAIPPSVDRPVQLNLLPLLVPGANSPIVIHKLAHHTTSLRLSTERLVKVPAAKTYLNYHGTVCAHHAHRRYLWIESHFPRKYYYLSIPMRHFTNISSRVLVTVVNCDTAHEQAWLRDAPGSICKPFSDQEFASVVQTFSSTQPVWFGELGVITSGLSDQKFTGQRRVVAIRRNEEQNGNLMLISARASLDAFDLSEGEECMTDIEEGRAMTMFRIDPASERQTRIESMSVDELSGLVCIVERSTDSKEDFAKVEGGTYNLKVLRYT